MSFFSWLRSWTPSLSQEHRLTRGAARKPSPFRPTLERLEARDLPSFGNPIYSAISQPIAMVAADVNGDGKEDAIVARANGGVSGVVMLGTGNGNFEPGITWGTVSGSTADDALAVADINGDGKLDIVTANDPGDGGAYGQNASVSVFLGNGDGTFSLFQTFQSHFAVVKPTSIAVADVNGDGRPDVLIAGDGGGIDVLYNAGTQLTHWTVTSYALPASTAGTSRSVAVGDFNGDNRPDIAVTNGTQVDVLLKLAAGGFAAPLATDVGGTPASLAVGDLNGDGRLDIVTANYENSVSVLAGNGNGTFAKAKTYAIGGAPNSIAVGDFNKDGKLDIVTTGAEMDVLTNTGNGTFGPYQTVGLAGSNVVAADLNGDGYLDLAQIDAAQTKLDVLLNTAQGSLAVAGFPASTTAGVAHTITVTALNADGSINTGFTDTVQFTSTDPQAILPASYSFTASDHGVHTFTFTLKTAGTQSLTATDTATGLTTTANGIVVFPGAPATFLLGAPSSVKSGSKFSVTLTVEDAYGNVSTNWAGGYTVQFSSSASTAALPANYTFTTADAGVHTFTNAFTLKNKGTQTITVTDLTDPTVTDTISITVI
jgi:hypothetical protein